MRGSAFGAAYEEISRPLSQMIKTGLTARLCKIERNVPEY
jgi:hypothetical protein